MRKRYHVGNNVYANPKVPVLLPPVALSASSISITIIPSQNDGAGIATYVYETSLDGVNGWTVDTTALVTNINDVGLNASTTYFYRVKARDNRGLESAYSQVQAATTLPGGDAQAPSTPTGITATAISTSRIDIGWSAATDNVGVTVYRLQQSLDGTSGWTDLNVANVLTYSNTGLADGSLRYYRVRAEDAAGNFSGWSSVVNATTPYTIKANFGHYMTIDTGSGGGGAAGWLAQIDGIAAESSIKGVNFVLRWKDAESTQGDYQIGFDIIDPLVARCASYGKQFMLYVETHRFGPVPVADAHDVCPAYLDSIDGGPAFNSTSTPWAGTLRAAARIWETATMDRYIALGQAYAARYNANPNFEMYGMSETSTGVPSGQFGFSDAKLLTQILRWMPAMRTAWANTAVRVQVNYLGSLVSGSYTSIAAIYASGQTNKITMGGPDCNEKANRTFWANEEFRGTTGSIDYRNTRGMPWVNELQVIGSSYGLTSTASTVYNDTLNGQPGMKAQYWVWVRGFGPGTGGSTTNQKWNAGTDGELQFIRSINGAVNTTRPTGY